MAPQCIYYMVCTISRNAPFRMFPFSGKVWERAAYVTCNLVCVESRWMQSRRWMDCFVANTAPAGRLETRSSIFYTSMMDWNLLLSVVWVEPCRQAHPSRPPRAVQVCDLDRRSEAAPSITFGYSQARLGDIQSIILPTESHHASGACAGAGVWARAAAGGGAKSSAAGPRRRRICFSTGAIRPPVSLPLRWPGL